MDFNQINSGVLAYIGDAVYEVEIRKYLVEKKINKVNDLQNKAISYVSAKAQSSFLDKLVENNVLTDEELGIIRRARNYKPSSKPKNTDIVTYKKATAFEALIGMLWLKQDYDRVKYLINLVKGD